MHTAAFSKCPGFIARVASGLLCLTGLALMLGWMRNITAMKSVLAALSSMAPILQEHLVGIPTVYRLRIGPSTFACAEARGAILNRVVDSSLFSRLCNQITL
jgi:hypothetical protein